MGRRKFGTISTTKNTFTPINNQDNFFNGTTRNSWARGQFLWFPLHPIGLLMCLTYPMSQMWFSIFLGWLAKTLISKFAGNEGYQKLVPFFLGLVLGSVVMMLFWLGINVLTGMTNYNLMPT